jgi:hypothetical protein
MVVGRVGGRTRESQLVLMMVGVYDISFMAGLPIWPSHAIFRWCFRSQLDRESGWMSRPIYLQGAEAIYAWEAFG